MEEIAPGIRQLDTLLGGMERLTAGFLVEGTQPALIETGSRSSTDTVVAALKAAGVGPEDLRWVVVSHIHLDHAGAVGDMARAFPRASVVVHRRGARHLADPSRLISSAAMVYGPLLDELYGRMLAVPEERLVAAGDGLELDIGAGRRLRLVDSPGHAKHHQAILDEQTGTLMVGDAVGVLLPDVGILRPATPPPDFDLELAIASLHRFRSLRPTHLVLTHYGPVPDPDATLARAEEELRRWVGLAERVTRERPDAGVDGVAAAFAETFVEEQVGMTDEGRRRFEVLNGLHSNAAGIVRYLSQRSQPRVPE
ncbi:MAG TPA: MBL fold metallo-hydrolase [Candidatus Binatia bacterium]|nr:MBL fold metallo-hydrolase [Candidatus Binatia bacterium]